MASVDGLGMDCSPQLPGDAEHLGGGAHVLLQRRWQSTAEVAG
ncbi:hypothetical protein ACWD4L_28240 [Streptomyces sp. NPDC002596]